MPDSVLHIPGLLKPEELQEIETLFAKAGFVDGRVTAHQAAKEVKQNLQVDAQNQQELPALQMIVLKALNSSPLFQAAVLPKHVYPFLFSKYTAGMQYGWHVDSPLMGDPPLRTDIAMTVFLSDPATYEGGELVIQANTGPVAFKPAKGDAIVYPCQFLHCVNQVRSGERAAAVTWIQSVVPSPQQRQILFNLQQVQGLLNQRDMHAPESNLLLQTYSNLLRLWAEG
jgi:PKHD-type hydroxylase